NISADSGGGNDPRVDAANAVEFAVASNSLLAAPISPFKRSSRKNGAWVKVPGWRGLNSQPLPTAIRGAYPPLDASPEQIQGIHFLLLASLLSWTIHASVSFRSSASLRCSPAWAGQTTTGAGSPLRRGVPTSPYCSASRSHWNMILPTYSLKA